jgi:hypothetical protein
LAWYFIPVFPLGADKGSVKRGGWSCFLDGKIEFPFPLLANGFGPATLSNIGLSLANGSTIVNGSNINFGIRNESNMGLASNLWKWVPDVTFHEENLAIVIEHLHLLRGGSWVSIGMKILAQFVKSLFYTLSGEFGGFHAKELKRFFSL